MFKNIKNKLKTFFIFTQTFVIQNMFFQNYFRKHLMKPIMNYHSFIDVEHPHDKP